jgi:3-deoxy-7-phosphoheptulonate synthase
MANHDAYRIVSRNGGGKHSLGTARRVVSVAGVAFGGRRPVVIAGPCTVESLEQTLEIALEVKSCGAEMLRGGAFKPRTSPYDFQGLGEDGLKILAEVRELTGLPVVTEVLDVRLVELVGHYADMLQVGSRNMQCFPLLTELGKLGKPVLLKRGMAATLQEWLCAAEYIAKEGNTQIVLCERGIRSFGAGEYSRFCLDLNVVTAVREATYLPVIVDPSHSTGRADMVPWASQAAIGCGADGLIIEVMGARISRSRLRCDADQAIRPATLQKLMDKIRQIAKTEETELMERKTSAAVV